MRKIKKALTIIRDKGVYNGTKIIVNKIKNKEINIAKRDIFTFYQYITYGQRLPLLEAIPSESIKLLWFIPDFGIGSGGHLNIFRMIYNLKKLGINSDIAICGDSQWLNAKVAKKTIDEHFFELECSVFIINNKEQMNELVNCHFAIATSWQTAYYVNYFNNCVKKAYFVQDFEPFFYPQGSSYVFAENTYKFGFYGITAGSWISEKLEAEYNMKCTDFSFSFDKELYAKQPKRDDKQRIFFYARPPTDRRGFELGIFALNELYKNNQNLEIILAGWDTSEYLIPFPHLNAGVVAINELSDLYSQCDVALVLSFTNLSLLPLELLSSGCPVVVNKGKNNSWIDTDGKLFIYTESTIEDIVHKVESVFSNHIQLDFDYIDDFLQNSSWEKEAMKVNQFIKNILDINHS